MCLQVAFDFTVDLSQLSRQGIVEASPMSGKVAAGEKARIKLKVGTYESVANDCLQTYTSYSNLTGFGALEVHMQGSCIRMMMRTLSTNVHVSGCDVRLGGSCRSRQGCLLA
jgi:hypothetical protein